MVTGQAFVVQSRSSRRRRHRITLAVLGAAVVVCTAVVLVVAALGSARPAADERYYRTSSALVAASDVVVLGTAGSSAPSPDEGFVRTTVRVTRSAGSDPGAVLVVTHPPATSQPGVDLADGGEYVLVLRSTGVAGEYALASTTQGAVPVAHGKPTKASVLDARLLARLGISDP